MPSLRNRLQIAAAATDPIHSYRQREYLGSFKASTMKYVHCTFLAMILIEIREGRIFWIGSHGIFKLLFRSGPSIDRLCIYNNKVIRYISLRLALVLVTLALMMFSTLSPIVVTRIVSKRELRGV